MEEGEGVHVDQEEAKDACLNQNLTCQFGMEFSKKKKKHVPFLNFKFAILHMKVKTYIISFMLKHNQTQYFQEY